MKLTNQCGNTSRFEQFQIFTSFHQAACHMIEHPACGGSCQISLVVDLTKHWFGLAVLHYGAGCVHPLYCRQIWMNLI